MAQREFKSKFEFIGTKERGYGARARNHSAGRVGTAKQEADGTWTAHYTLPPKRTPPGEPQPCKCRDAREGGFRTRQAAAEFMLERKVEQERARTQRLKDKGLL